MEKSKKSLVNNGGYNKAYLFILFLMSPIIALIYAVKNFSNKSYHVIILMFAFLYGYTFLIIPFSDSTRYRIYYQNIAQYTWSDFLYQIVNVYSGASSFSDIYLVSLSYLCTRFDANFHIFLGIHSVIYFSLLIGIGNTILDNISQFDYKRYLVYFIGALTLFSLASGIVGIRFQIGFMIFFYFALKYIFSNKLKYVILAGLSFLSHISLIPVCLGLLLFYLLSFVKGFRLKLFFVLLFLIILTNINISDVAEGVDNDIVTEKVGSYTNDNFVKNREDHTKKWNWYLQLRIVAGYNFLIAALFLTRLKIFRLKTNKTINKFFLLTLILFGIAVFNSTFLDSISNRYNHFFNFIGLLYLFFLFSFNETTRLSVILKWIYFFILILNILIGLRVDSYTFDVIRLTLSPIFILLGLDEGANMYDFL
jgi:hypothetical protein